jgi:hypothetical protein
VLGLDYAAKEHPAVHAGVGALQASVMRLYSVVLPLGGWVRWVRGRLIHVNLPIGWPGPEEWRLLRDHFFGRCPLHPELYHL